MILHTIVPTDEVMKGFDDAKYNYLDIDVGGVQMQVNPIGIGQGRLVRLLSTDPAMYLKPEYQPGSIIQWPSTPSI